MTEANRYLIIDGDTVVNVVLAIAPSDVHSAAALDVVAAPDDLVGPGYRRLPNGQFEPPEMPTPDAAELAVYAADKRWRVENGGITVGGVEVATDDRAKTMIMGARIKASEDPGFSTRWKTASGFVVIDAATILAISDAVLAHVDACFTTEADVLAAIDGGTITTTADIDAAFAD